MTSRDFSSKWVRLQELLVITLVGELPTILLGPKLRNLLYRNIFHHIGSSVYIQEGVEFIGTSSVEIGNGVHIFKGVRIDSRGHQNNRICLEDGVAIERNTNIGCLNNSYIEIGEETFIGPDVCIAGPGDIKIGKRCLIAAHTGIFANNHNFSDPREPIKYQGISRQGIVIEDDCWLGHKVTVLDGVTIGEGSVIGAGAVVTKDVPPYSVAMGIPARVVKSRIDKQLVNNSID
ncbi:acyltransferase [Iningainema tapete]|uniref:Acyltransferase n=1 Tax=Iningainema tapete BLCC-T55 TaxID=2748662 RepID=A0A8J7CF60_9CYAN|nr:acyltransferase [Iningainema tapete]MBD2774375.1 acyltransferase [Iningainema tapete BLCC-T55]